MEVSKKNERFVLLRGQSLVELLIAVSIAGFFIAGATITVTTALKSGGSTEAQQTGAFFAQELLDQASAVAIADWHNIDPSFLNCAPSANEYYFTVGGGSLVRTCGREQKTFSGADYTRYITVLDVYRQNNRGGGIALANCAALDCNDPSTKRIVSTATWMQNGIPQTLQLTTYVTRSRAKLFEQTDWSGGALQVAFPGSPSAPNNKFFSASSTIATTSPSGSITLK